MFYGSEEAGNQPPPVTNYIGECFLKIATHLSYRPNFINYTYKDEMISDGIENCYSMLQTSIQRSQRTLSHTSHKLSTTPFCVEYKKRKNKRTLKTKLLKKQTTNRGQQ